MQDLCQTDVRWNALKSLGERKQCFAEYQNIKLKNEKETKRVHAKKCRDAFFQVTAILCSCMSCLYYILPVFLSLFSLVSVAGRVNGHRFSVKMERLYGAFASKSTKREWKRVVWWY